jgi:hypothetical protein
VFGFALLPLKSNSEQGKTRCLKPTGIFQPEAGTRQNKLFERRAFREESLLRKHKPGNFQPNTK